MRSKIVLMTIASLILGAASAQSLGELAKKERERREKEAKVPRVIRNEDLKNLRGARVTQSSPQVEPAPVKGEAVVAGPGTPAPAETTAAPQPALDENYWRSAFREGRLLLRLAQNRELVLELRINDLRNRVLAQSDASTRTLIEQELTKTVSEFEANKLEIIKAEEALKKLEEAAKRANVPAAWTREEIPTPPAGQLPTAPPPAQVPLAS